MFLGSLPTVVKKSFIDSVARISKLSFLRAEYPRAEVACRLLLAINPNDWEALARLGDTYLRSGAFQAAIVVFDRLRRLDPTCAETIGFLATAHAHLFGTVKAREILEVALTD
jgi:Flp pilus assembly protein TadD